MTYDPITRSPEGKAVELTREPWELFGLAGCAIAAGAFITTTNTPAIATWLLALLVFGVGQSLLFPPALSVPLSLITVVAWVLIRQMTGLWNSTDLVPSLIGLVAVGLSLLLGLRFRAVWYRQQRALAESRELREVVVGPEMGTGLLARQVGELRLNEETDRARSFHRPLGLMIVEVESAPDQSAEETAKACQAIFRQLASTAQVHDIPFRLGPDQAAVILPERSWEELCNAAETVRDAVREAVFWGADGQPLRARSYVRLHFGVGAYRGEEGTVDLLRAAQDSLHIGRDLGELEGCPLADFVMPATPTQQNQ